MQKNQVSTICVYMRDNDNVLAGVMGVLHCFDCMRDGKGAVFVFKPPHSVQLNQYNNSFRIGTILEVLCVTRINIFLIF